MSDSDLPQGTASGEAMSIDQVDAALEEMIDDPALGLIDDEEIQQEQATQETDEGDELDDVDGEAEPNEDDESEESDADQDQDIVELSDDMEIDLGDGVKATLSQLKADFGHVQKREQDMQRDYTQKQMALSDERKKFETESADFIKWADQLGQQSQLLNNLQAQLMQAPNPELLQTDPVGYMQQKEAYDQTLAMAHQAQQQMQANQQAFAQRQQEQLVASYQEQRDIFQKNNPQFAGDNFRKFEQQVLTEVKDAYGFDENFLKANVTTAPIMEVIKDALSYRKVKASTSKTKAKIEGKPPVMKSGKSKRKSNSPSADLASRKAKFMKSGNASDFEALLMDYDI